jgi:hypothetical protein
MMPDFDDEVPAQGSDRGFGALHPAFSQTDQAYVYASDDPVNVTIRAGL